MIGSISLRTSWCDFILTSALILSGIFLSQLHSQTIEISSIDTLVDLDKDVSVYLDTSRSQPFEEVQNKSFNPLTSFSKNTQAIHWYKFKLQPKVDARYLTIYFWGSDLSNVHVPSTSGYYKVTTGRIAKQHINFNRYERSSVTLAVESIDFSKPFFVNKHPISFWGRSNLKYPVSVYLSMNKMYDSNKLYQDTKLLRYISFLSVFLISFILLLVTYFITKDKNYRNYSFYLLALILLFLGRIPLFYNAMNSIHPKIYLFLTQTMHIVAAGIYLYFVNCFVDFKSKSGILHKISRNTVIGIFIFGIVSLLLMVFFPYFKYRFSMVIVFEVLFTLISLFLFTGILFKKPTFPEKIVLIGSQLLVLGNVLTIIYNDNTYFIITALAEIIAFSSALTIKNKFNEHRRLETKFILEKERNEKLALIEMSRLKSSFFTNISHEFRTPLSLIKGPLEDQLHRDDLADHELRNLKIAQTNTQRMERLVEQLLALAKLESGKLKLNVQPGSISQFLAAQLASFDYHIAEKNLQLITTIEPSEKLNWFDRDALEKVLINLIGNAVKYTPEGESIIFSSEETIQGTLIRIQNKIPEGTSIDVDRVFDRFYQSNDTNSGSGIGLALTKELIELHHGSIDVQIIEGSAIVFEVRVPTSEDTFASNEKLATELNSSLETSPKEIDQSVEEEKNDLDVPLLLIVDDNSDIRTYLSGIFESEYVVHSAVNGKEGFEKAESLIPDIIISDLKMPVLDGFQFTDQCKSSELTSHIPIILLTAKDADEHSVKATKLGADAFISKPFSSSFLKATVANLLKTRRKLQERYSQELILKTQEVAVTSAEEHFLKRMQQVLDTNLTNSDFTSKQFSVEMHMSRMQLHRKLKALTGLSTSEFLRSQRLKAAAHLLKQDKISISEVGYSVGFNDPSYFTKSFKQEFGVSPSQFAKK